MTELLQSWSLRAILKTSKTNKPVQENAFALLRWFEYLLREERGGHEANEVEKLIIRPAALSAIWRAAIARRFSDRAAYKLRKLPQLLEACGGTVKVPRWWKGAISSFEKRFRIKRSEDAENSP